MMTDNVNDMTAEIAKTGFNSGVPGHGQTFVKKPVQVMALRYTGASGSEADVEAFVGAKLETRNVDGVLCPVIPTLEGEHIASPGDWIIRGVKGEHYPCKPDIFEATYDRV